MTTFTEMEKKVLLALSDLEPASLTQLADRTGIDPDRLKAVLSGLAQRGLLTEQGESEQERREK
jgi:DNA-binding MarR family transcriptional regulator